MNKINITGSLYPLVLPLLKAGFKKNMGAWGSVVVKALRY
jgi:hypothetical protein